MADRISQVAVDVVIDPTSQTARVSQVVAEAIVDPTSQSARASQVAVEVVLTTATVVWPSPGGGRSYATILG